MNQKKKTSKKQTTKTVETLTHDDASRKHIPTAEFQSVMAKEHQSPIRVAYERRNRDLDPQLVWRGKDEQDWSDLVVQAPPLFIQEKVHPKVLIDDLLRRTREQERKQEEDAAPLLFADLYSDFNGVPEGDARTEFYQHDANWSNRMILGDSLAVMASLAEREGLRGQVQCIYIDPPYGIKFNSNFQWSTTSRDVKDGNVDHITREPEQVKAFRDTWRDGIHSYLTYLRDRLAIARDLLTDSGSVFVQIGDENIHRVRAVMDEVFGDSNFLIAINYVTTSGFPSRTLTRAGDSVLWYAKNSKNTKYRQVFAPKDAGDEASEEYKWLMLENGSTRSLSEAEFQGTVPIPAGAKRWRYGPLTSSGSSDAGTVEFEFRDRVFHPGTSNHWKISTEGLQRLDKAGLLIARRNSIAYYLFAENYPVQPITNNWRDTKWGFDASEKMYVVQTNSKVAERCLLMATDPGDLVLDPTCGSGTTAFVAEQWGRRWITIDTSRVALALARARIMGARYPYYLLADSKDGRLKEAEVTRTDPSTGPIQNNIRHGFVYERVPHITLKSIANNAEIDVIWEKYQQSLEPLRNELNKLLGQDEQDEQDDGMGKNSKKKSNPVHPVNPVKKPLEEWEIPREADAKWSDKAKKLHAQWWEQRIARQKEIDASIAAKAEFEFLYDKPYEDKKKVRVAGPFTVESLSPHRTLGVGVDDELLDPAHPQSPSRQHPNRDREGAANEADFARMILENLRTAGVQQAHKEDKLTFTSIAPWPGKYICAEGRYLEGAAETGKEKRAGIFVGPEFGTVQRQDLVTAAREAGDADFDVLIACAFNYEAHASEFNKLGRIPVLKARMNADLHMADTLKNTGKGNLFVIFGEPDIDILPVKDGSDRGKIRVKINGVDVFHPSSGEVRSDGADGIACWFIDSDYNEESFFVRQAYFLGANDPYKSLKTTLKAEINEDAWATLNSDTSRPFDKPKSGRIAVKVINHLGDEVMKVFEVE